MTLIWKIHCVRVSSEILMKTNERWLLSMVLSHNASHSRLLNFDTGAWIVRDRWHRIKNTVDTNADTSRNLVWRWGWYFLSDNKRFCDIWVLFGGKLNWIPNFLLKKISKWMNCLNAIKWNHYSTRWKLGED